MPASKDFDEFIANFPKLKKPIFFGKSRARQSFKDRVQEHLADNLHLIDDEDKEFKVILLIAKKKDDPTQDDYDNISLQTLQAALLTYATTDLKFLPFLSNLSKEKQAQLLEFLNDQNSLAPLSLEQFARVQKGFLESSQLALADAYLAKRGHVTSFADLLEISKNFGAERLDFLNGFLSKKQADGKSMFESIQPTEFAESIANQSELEALTLAYLKHDLGGELHFQTLSLQEFVRLNMEVGYNAGLAEAYRSRHQTILQDNIFQLLSPEKMLETIPKRH